MTEPPTRKYPVWLPFAVPIGVAVVLGILFTALSSPENRPSAPPKTFTLTGTLTVPGGVGADVLNGECVAKLGYDDIQSGTGVTVYDASGKVLAVGSLGNGQASGFRCAYSLTVSAVPRDEGFYQVEVASRGKVAFDESALVSSGASLTLG